jgi:hypothetical protein
MPAVAVQTQDELWIQGAKWSFSKFQYNASAETVTVPYGAIQATAFVDSGTAPTAAITAGADTDSVALTSGTVNKLVTLVCKHSGSAA